jgi:hypothetical protein
VELFSLFFVLRERQAAGEPAHTFSKVTNTACLSHRQLIGCRRCLFGALGLKKGQTGKPTSSASEICLLEAVPHTSDK